MKTIIKYNFTRRISSFLIAVIVISTMQSCVKDNFQFDKIAEVQWDPNVAAPLVYASLSIKDMLDNSGGQAYVVEAGDKSLTIVYNDTVVSIDASSLVKLPEQSFQHTIAAGAALPTPFSSGTFTVTSNQTVPFISGTNGPLIDSMTLKAGILVFLFNSDLSNSGSIKITIPKVKKNGVAFSQTLPLNYSGSLPATASGNFDATGYNFDMTSGGAPYNQFIVKYDVALTGSAIAPVNTDNIDVTFSMNSLEFSKIFGDIGTQNLSLPSDTIDLSMFTTATGAASFTLVDPRIKVTIANSYGIPIDARLTNFDGYNAGVNYYPITGFPNPLPILSPNLTQVGQVLVDSFKLDNTNSNIATLLNNTPKQIVYKLDAYTNVGGPTQNNFILDTSRFQMDLAIELPLYGTAKNFVLVDSIPFDFSDTEFVPDEVESGLIRTYNSNGFPIDIDMQVYFVDSLYVTLDSLVSPNQILLKSGTVNPATGRVTSAKETIFDATVNKARLLKIKNAKNIIIKAKASTTNSGTTNVKIYSDYTLGFKLGVQVQMRVQAKR